MVDAETNAIAFVGLCSCLVVFLLAWLLSSGDDRRPPPDDEHY